MAILSDDCIKLQVASIGVNVKWFVMIGISEKSIGGCQCFHLIECFFGILESIGTCLCQSSWLGGKNVAAMGPHVTTVSY